MDAIQWPASMEEVVGATQANGAPDGVIQRLQADGREQFTGPNEVHNVLWMET